MVTFNEYSGVVSHPDKLFNDEQLQPGDALRELLDSKGWTREELAAITGRSRQNIYEILSGRNGVTPEMAVILGAAFSNEPSYWLKLDAHYRLKRLNRDSTDVEQRARIFSIAPIRDMQRRGWIGDTKSLEKLERELKQFFGAESLDQITELSVSTRRSGSYSSGLTIAQKAWCFRVRQMAHAMPLKRRFDASRLNSARRDLRRLAALTKDARRVPTVLADYGIRFIVVEPLPGIKVDGVALWLDNESPVIGVSVRFDRIDAFWFTLMHEFSHIYHGDALSFDMSLVGGDDSDEQPMLLEDEMERRANEEAASYLIAAKDIDSFIRRVGPLYSKQRIVQFANRIKIHPGIIVGQLQNRNEIGYSANREMLTKIREVVAQTALTDGWGRTINALFLLDSRGI